MGRPGLNFTAGMGVLKRSGYDIRTAGVCGNILAGSRFTNGDYVQGCRCGRKLFLARSRHILAIDIPHATGLLVGIDSTALDATFGSAETSIPSLVPSSTSARAYGLSDCDL
jgi:hypothetical protein